MLKGARLEPIISEDAISANKRAEERRKSQQLSYQRANAAATEDSLNGDTDGQERVPNETEDTDDPADAAFYSGYVNARMRPHDQLAWGNGRPNNTPDGTGAYTVSMTDYPPLIRNEHSTQRVSLQRIPPGFEKPTSGVNNTSVNSADRDQHGTCNVNDNTLTKQLRDRNRQTMGNGASSRVSGGQQGQRAVVANTSGGTGRDTTINGARSTGANTPTGNRPMNPSNSTNK